MKKDLNELPGKNPVVKKEFTKTEIVNKIKKNLLANAKAIYADTKDKDDLKNIEKIDKAVSITELANIARNNLSWDYASFTELFFRAMGEGGALLYPGSWDT